MKRLMALIFLVATASTVARPQAEKTNGPDCSDGWPTNMTFVHLKNAGLADNTSIDFSKTKASRLASEKIGRDLWHQVYRVVFTKKSGEIIEAIAVHNASLAECSMSGVEVFVVSSHLNADRK
jgi:hypothetical protein